MKLIAKFFVGFVFSLGFIFLSQSSAQAQVNDKPDTKMYDVDNAWESGHTGRIRAVVFDFQELNGRMYVGGKFQEVIRPDGGKIQHSFLAAFDLRSGEYISSFKPQLDGPVYALNVRDDGKLLASGEMTGGIVAIDPISGQIDSQFKPNIRNSWGRPAVYDIEVVGNQIYAGGTFVRTGNTPTDQLARLDSKTGQLDTSWMPTVQRDVVTPNKMGGELVYGLDIDTSRDRVYVVGKFGGINDNQEAAFFATLGIKEAKLKQNLRQGLPKNTLSHRYEKGGFSMWQHDVQHRGDKVYLGGQAHQTIIMNASDLKATGSFFSNKGVGDQWSGGDTQVLFIGKNTVWAGCHCWGSVGPYKLGSYISKNPGGPMVVSEYHKFRVDFNKTNPFGQQKVHGLYGIDIASGKLVKKTFNLFGQGGAWGLTEDSLGQLWAGGQFSSGGGREIKGLTRFLPEGGVQTPTVKSCKAEPVDNKMVIKWDSEVPNQEAYKFVIKSSTDGGPSYWRGRVDADKREFTEALRTGKLDYSVHVRVGNTLDETGVKCENVEVEKPNPVPQGLRVTRTENSLVVINWQANGEIEIERNGQIVGKDSDGWFTDRGLTKGTEYKYRIRFTGANSWSDVVSTTTTGGAEPVPVKNPAPASCSWSASGDQVAVKWDPVNNANDVVIHKFIAGNNKWTWTAKVKASDLTFTDTTKDSITKYSVKATYNDGDSEYVICNKK